MNLLRHFGDESQMLTVTIPLDAVSERPAGSVVSVHWSVQTPSMQRWKQATLGPRRAFVVEHGSTTPDAQQIVSYYPPGFTADALWLWARRIAWPRLRPGPPRRTDLLSSIAEPERVRVREAMLQRTPTTATATFTGGPRLHFEVSETLPHLIEGWRTSDESGQLISCERAAEQ
jgi:hypothetical protein